MGKTFRVFACFLFFAFLAAPAFGAETEIFGVDWQGDEEIHIYLVDPGQVYQNGSTFYFSNTTTGLRYTTGHSWPSFVQYNTSIDFYNSNNAEMDISRMTALPEYTRITIWIERQEWSILNIFDGWWKTTKEYSAALYVYRDNTGPALTISGGQAFTRDSVSLSASASDTGSGLDTGSYAYSINGGAYTSGRSLSLSAEGSYRVTFQAKDRAGNTSWASTAVTIDRTAPAVSVSGGTGDGWSNAAALTLTASAADTNSGVDGPSWQHYPGGGSGSAWSGPGTGNNRVTLNGEGVQQVTFKVKDRAGNEGAGSTTARIDRTPPGSSLTGDMGDSWSSDASRSLSVSASDDRSGIDFIESSRDGGAAWTREGSTGSAAMSFSGEGRFTGAFRVWDRAGNSTTVRGTINLDRQPPVISNFSVPVGWIKPDVAFSGITIRDSTQNSGITSGVNPNSLVIRPHDRPGIAIPGGHYKASDGTLGGFTVTLPSGTYSLTLSAADNVGNQASSVIPAVKIDGVPPVFSGSVNGVPRRNGSGWSIPILLTGVSDPHSGVHPQGWRYSIDGGAETAFTPSVSGEQYRASITAGALAGGTHRVTISGRDYAGNGRSEEYGFTVDDVPPVIDYDSLLASSPDSAAWTSKSRFPLSASDVGSGIESFTVEIKRQQNNAWVSAGDARFSENSIEFLPGTVDGVFQISALAADKAGSGVSKTLYVKVDRTLPVLSLPSGISGSSSVAASASDASSGLDEGSWEWKIEDGIWRAGNCAVLSPGINRRFSFRVRDRAGNSVEKSGEITVDTSPPALNASVSPFAAGDRLMAGALSVEDGISGVSSVWYRIDNGEAVTVSAWPVTALEIPVAAYNEGRRRIQFGAQDRAGNTGLSGEYPFIIDRSPPVINGAEIREASPGERILEDFDFTAAPRLAVRLRGRDAYRDGNLSGEGAIAAWYWDIRRDKNEAPAFQESRRSTDAAFTLRDCGEGINYLYIRGEDAGGNHSETFRRIVSLDKSVPAPPVIRSPTHEEAFLPEQAGFLPEARFRFFPAAYSQSGITGYLWRLQKLILQDGAESAAEFVSEGRVDDLDPESAASLSLTLGDNGQNEFYRLTVQCLGGNGLTGLPGEYRFRIDTTAPKEVRIRANPQLNPRLWYHDRNAVVLWNKPADMTGVAEYRYWAGPEDSYRSPGGEDDPPGWIKTTTNEARIDLKNLLGNRDAGAVGIEVCAIDYAGNRKTGFYRIQNDYGPPFFKAESGKAPWSLTDAPAEVGKAKHISWVKPGDAESGVERITLSVMGEQKAWSYTLEPDTEEFTLDRLDDDTVYTLVLRAYDYAGNMAELHQVFALGGAELPPRYQVPYQESVNGFELSGKRIISTGSGETLAYEDLRLDIPQAVILNEIESAGGVETRRRISSLPLEDVRHEGRLPLTGQSRAGSFEAQADGFVIRGGGIFFDRDRGVFLSGSVYTRTLEIAGLELPRTINLGNVSLGIPPAARFNGGPGFTEAPAILRSFSETGEGYVHPGFLLGGIENIGLRSGKEWFTGRAVTVHTGLLADKGIRFTTGDGDYNLPLTEAGASAGSKNPEAEIRVNPEYPPRLVLGGAEYAVIKAGIRGSSVNIYEATLKLPENYEPRELRLRNFILDGQNGTVRMGPDYQAGNIKAVSPNGTAFELSSIEFDLDGRLLVSGAIHSGAYGVMSFKDLPLTHGGLDWETGARLQGFNVLVHGFAVSAVTARFTREGILIEEGAIDLYGAGRPFSGLGLTGIKPDEIYAAGKIKPYYAQTNYGSPLLVREGRIEPAGVYAVVTVPLNPGVKDAAGRDRWDFAGTRLYPSGLMEGVLEPSPVLTIAGFSLNAGELVLTGDSIRAGTLSPDTIPGLTGDSVTFRDFEFNETAVLVPGRAEGAFVFQVSGWALDYTGLRLDHSGIGGAGTLRLPSRLGGKHLGFPESLLHPDGVFHSGIAGPEEANIVETGGLPLRFTGAVLARRGDAYVLQSDAPFLSLKTLAGPDMYFGETIFDAQGRVLSCEAGTTRIKFAAANGYLVDSDCYRIGDDGIRLEGSLGALWWNDGDAAAITGEGIQLLPDYGVSGTAVEGEIPYQYGDWTLTGKNITFGKDTLTIKNNQVSYRGAEIALGEFAFNAQGLLREAVEIRQEQDFPLVLGFGVTLTKTRFHHEGLDAAVAVRLPAFLGKQDLAFEKIRLKADGMFSLEKTIEDLRFTLGGMEFAFQNLTLDSAGVYAASAELTLPAAQENKPLALRGLRISKDSLTLEDARISPFHLWGMLFRLDSFSITHEGVAMTGLLELPPVMPGELAGLSCEIREFSIGFDGQVYALDVYSEGTYTIPFLENWSLSINGPKLRYVDDQPWVVMEGAVLHFPAGYEAAGAFIDQVRFNPVSGVFDYASIYTNGDIAMNLGGMEFVLTGLRIDSALAVSFGGFVRFPSQGLPGFIAGKIVTIDVFEIRKDGSLGRAAVFLDGLEGEVAPGFDGLWMAKGKGALIKNGSRSLLLSVTGSVMLTAAMPEPLAGRALHIDSLIIDLAAPAITRFQAKTYLPELVFWGNQFTGITAGIVWDQAHQAGLLELSGFIKLPGSFPGFLAGQEAVIKDFTIGFDGGVRTLAAAYSTEPGKAYNAFGAVQLSDVGVDVSLSQDRLAFDLAGTAILGADQFPRGIGGNRARVAMRFDTISGLIYAAGSLSITDQNLFGNLEVRNFGLRIVKDESGPLHIDVSGQVLLPDSFPQGLRGMAVDIHRFTLDSAGGISALDIGLSGVNTRIFGLAELKNGTMDFRLGKKDELLLSVGGTVRLNSPGLPPVLRNTELRVKELVLSTKQGLQTFKAGLGSPLSFKILGGLQVNINSLLLEESCITLDAGLYLPAHYPEGLANTRIDLKTLKLDWNGRLVDIQGGLGAANFNLAGFTVQMRRLYFEKDPANQFWVTLESCRLRLPPHVGSLGSQYISLKNARFSPETGAFMGDIEATRLVTEIAGFRVEIKTPCLEIAQKRISCESAIIQPPAFLGNSAIALHGLRISASEGVSLSGGGFRLPGFNVGGLSFSNVEVNFYSQGSETALGGGGAVFIPGAGTIAASLSFITKSSAYPLGLKQAEFSYTLAAGGIPLGGTGLFLNGIAGGITYGPPVELPWKVQGMFNPRGPRLKLGLHLGDAYGGTLLDMSPVVWVDINNASWAFQGTASILRGKLDITSELTAALSAAGFYGGAAVELRFVRGGVDMYIFNKAGRVVFSGEGYVQFGLPKGAIMNTTILFTRISVPPVDMWLGNISAVFGPFSNGKTGFKGFVELPLLGQKGVFAAPGTFVIGNVSSYRVEKPGWAAPSLRGSRLPTGNSGPASGVVLSRPEPVIYQVLIPGLPGGEGETGLERIVFMLAYTEGDPAVTVVSPSGKEYREGSAKTETVFMENVFALIVYAPESGIWNIRVENMGEDFFKLNVLGGEKVPQLAIDEPGGAVTAATGSFRLRGKADVGNAAIVVHAREGMGKPGRELGEYWTDQNGVFDVEVPVQDLSDGEYVISAQFKTGDMEASPVVYAAGKILVDRSALPLNMPGPLRAAETDPGSITLNWENTNGGRGINYKLRLRDQDTGEELAYTTGNITAMTLPGYRAGQRLSFEVSALDGTGGESAYTPPVHITAGAPLPVLNRPQIAESLIRVEGRVGGFAEGSIPITIADYQAAADASGYLRVRETGEASRELGQVVFGGPQLLTGTEAAIPWYAGFAETIKPGAYTVSGEVINEANGGLSAPFNLEFRIDWPDPEIYALEPAEINGREETRISVHGRGFMPGTRVFWREQELPLLPSEGPFTSTVLEFLLPPQGETGTFPVTITGPGGQTASFPLAVFAPDWNINLYTRQAETVPGGSLSYVLGVTGINGFGGSASFTLVTKPPELEVTLPVIPAGTVGAVQISVSPGAAPGIYTTAISGGPGKTFDLITLVRETPSEPRLTGYSPAVVFAGSEVHLYGYALGGGGELHLNGKTTETLSWTESKIVFAVPPDGTGGSLRVLTAGGGSNVLPFAIRNRGFTIRPGVGQLELNPGESRVVPLSVSGYADTVYLTAEAEPGAPLKILLDKTTLKPNGIVNLTLQAWAAAEKGPRKVVIRGKSGAYESAASITVRIQDALTIEGGPLPQALLGVSYYGKLESGNSVGETEYHLAGGELPPGLELSRQGEIRGRPSREGSYPVLIEGRDGALRSGSASFVINVREDAWARAAKDGGQSRFVCMDLPADKKEDWTFPGGEAAAYLLAAEDHILGLFPGEIRALHAGDGSEAWSLPGAYRQLLYAGLLYARTAGNVLEARDIKTGALLWHREGIVSVSGSHGLILAGFCDTGGAGCLVLDASRGTLVEQLPDQPKALEQLLWQDNRAYQIEEKGLQGVYGSGSFLEAEGGIYAAAADTGGFVLAGEKALILLDRDLREIRRIPRGSRPEVKLVLAEDAVLLWDGGLLSEYRREDLALSWTRTVQDSGSIAAGLDKAVIAGPEGLVVLNRSTGSPIWEDKRPFRGAALYREKIYAAGSGGHITAFGGPSNLYPPEVEIQIQPAAPDGNNDWYITKPAVQFRGFDRETRAVELKMAYNDGEWQDAAEALILEDGEHRISAYGTDSKGLRSREVRALVRVDTDVGYHGELEFQEGCQFAVSLYNIMN